MTCPVSNAELLDLQHIKEIINMNNNNYNQPPQIVYVQQPQPTKYSGMCIAGFITSFFLTVIPFIFCIIGISECNTYHYRGAGLGIAGLTITILKAVFLVFTVLIS